MRATCATVTSNIVSQQTATANQSKCACDWQFMDFWCFIILLLKTEAICVPHVVNSIDVSPNIHWIFCASKENGNENGNQHIIQHIDSTIWNSERSKVSESYGIVWKKKTVALCNSKREEKEKQKNTPRPNAVSLQLRQWCSCIVQNCWCDSVW